MQLKWATVLIYSIGGALYVRATTAVLNVSLVAVGYTAPFGLSSFAYIGPSMSWGTEYVQKKYSRMRFQLSFLYDRVRNTCPDLRDVAAGLVSEWHYRKRTDSDLTVYFNPACTEGTEIPYFQSQWNTLWFTTLIASLQIRDRTANPTWIAVNHYSSSQCAELFLEIFNKFNWTTISLVIDGSPTSAPIYAEQASNVLATVQKQRNITTNPWRIATTKGVPYGKFGPILEDIRSVSRIVLFFGNAAFLREFMVTASSMSMTNGEYVYFALETMQNYKVLGKLHWQYHDDNDLIAFQAIQSLLVVQDRDADLPPNTKLGPELIQRSARDYNFTYNLADQYFPTFADNFVGILALAEVLNETLAAGSMDYRDGAALAKRFLNRSFTHDYGSMFIDKRGERRSNFIVAYFDSTGNRTPFLAKPGESDSLTEIAQVTTWANSTSPFPPPNEPFCGYRNDRPRCSAQRNEQWVFAVALGLSAGFVVLILCITCWRYSKLKENKQLLANPWWQISSDALQPLSFSRASSLFDTGKSYNEATSHLSHSKNGIRFASYRKKPVICCMLARGNYAMTFEDLSAHFRLLKLIKLYHGLEHQNLCQFYGISLEHNGEQISNVFAVFACPTRGNLPSLSRNSISKDFDVASSFIMDFLEGLDFIHHSSFEYHGRLSLFNCWVDKHFTLKIMHLNSDRVRNELQAGGCNRKCLWSYAEKWEPFFWLPPEVQLLDDLYQVKSTQAVDIFSSGFILYDILTRGSLYHSLSKTSGIARPPTSGKILINPLREAMDFSKEPDFAKILWACLESDPLRRPTVKKLRYKLAKISPLLSLDQSQHKLFDKIQQRLSSYATELEREVVLRARALNAEKRRCDDLIKQFLPNEIVKKLRAGRVVAPELFDTVTVMFTDLYRFTEFVRSQPLEHTICVVGMAEDLFDRLSSQCNVYKVEAVVDTFLVASGLPKRIANEHVNRITIFALNVVEAESTLSLLGDLRFRIGIHSGPCAAGVIGIKRPRYCLFGDTVNVASRMCSEGMPGRIHLSSSAVTFLTEFHDRSYTLEQRSPVVVKGIRDRMVTYWLVGGNKVPQQQALDQLEQPERSSY